jgi:hypothetical protein
VFLEELTAELAESLGPVLEHPQDRFSVSDAQSEHLHLAAPRVLEPVAQLVKPGGAQPARELEHTCVGHLYACKEHVFASSHLWERGVAYYEPGLKV